VSLQNIRKLSISFLFNDLLENALIIGIFLKSLMRWTFVWEKKNCHLKNLTHNAFSLFHNCHHSAI
jgi:hypothetical protein